MTYTIVTVAHQDDYEALYFQARSMAKYLPPSLIHQIIIIENPKLQDHARLISQYGKLKNRVKIVAGASLAPPEAFSWSGWWSQQILKLMVAQIVETPRYLCLDAKNVLVFPLRRKFLERREKPRSFEIDYTTHSSLRWLRHTLDYFGLPETHIKAFVPTTTPFVLVTDLVKELIRYIEGREGTSLAAAFLKHQLTEFFLYGGFLKATNRFNYDVSGEECHTVWDVVHGDDYVHGIIKQTEKKKLPFFSVHRRAIPKLSEHARQEIIRFWTRRGLGSGVL